MSYPFGGPVFRKIPGFIDIRRVFNGFETPADSVRESLIRQKHLNNSGRADDQELAQKLASCKIGSRCQSAACSYCSRINRVGFYHETKKLSNKYLIDIPPPPGGYDSYDEAIELYPFRISRQRILTLVFYSEAMTDEQLSQFDPQRLKDRLRQQITRSYFENPVIGGLEFDYHEDIELWIPHFHLLVTDDVRPIKWLRMYYINEWRPISANHEVERISRPVMAQQIKDTPAQLSYLCKQRPQSIRSYRFEGEKWRTRKLRLDRKRSCLALRVLDRVGFNGLLFLYGARLVGREIKVNLVSEKK